MKTVKLRNIFITKSDIIDVSCLASLVCGAFADDRSLSLVVLVINLLLYIVKKLKFSAGAVEQKKVKSVHPEFVLSGQSASVSTSQTSGKIPLDWELPWFARSKQDNELDPGRKFQDARTKLSGLASFAELMANFQEDLDNFLLSKKDFLDNFPGYLPCIKKTGLGKDLSLRPKLDGRARRKRTSPAMLHFEPGGE
jgi:hypothetical protein